MVLLHQFNKKKEDKNIGAKREREQEKTTNKTLYKQWKATRELRKKTQ